MDKQESTPRVSYADLGEDEKRLLRGRVEKILADESLRRPDDRIRAVRDILPDGMKHMVLDVYLDVTNRIAHRRLRGDQK